MSASDDTTDAVAEAREMIAAFEVISGGRTRYEGQPERADERYDRNRRALVARIEDLEAKVAAMTRERDAACYAALEMRDVIKDLQAALETRTAPPQ